MRYQSVKIDLTGSAKFYQKFQVTSKVLQLKLRGRLILLVFTREKILCLSQKYSDGTCSKKPFPARRDVLENLTKPQGAIFTTPVIVVVILRADLRLII